jgi:hypothetical protein
MPEQPINFHTDGICLFKVGVGFKPPSCVYPGVSNCRDCPTFQFVMKRVDELIEKGIQAAAVSQPQ